MDNKTAIILFFVLLALALVILFFRNVILGGITKLRILEDSENNNNES